MISLVAASLAIAAQRPAVGPPPDRSGEPVLKALMNDFASLGEADILLSVDTRFDGYDPDYQMPFELRMKSNKVYRLDISGMWGDQNVFVSDGKTFLHDAEDDSVPIELGDANKPLYELSDLLSPNGGFGSPLWYFLDGAASLDKLADPKGAITVVPADAPLKAVKFESKSFGTVTVFYRPGSVPEVSNFAYDNLPFLKQMHEQDPDDYPDPAGAMTRQNLAVRRLKEAKGMFSTMPLKGHEVSDRRKKGSLE